MAGGAEVGVAHGEVIVGVRPLAGAIAFVRAHAELLFVIGLTAFAAVLRLWQLDTFPDGFHNDEGNVLLDAQRILDEGWIGAWSRRAAGYPIAVNYWVAPFAKWMDNTVLSVRLPMALLGAATIPVAYWTFRLAAGWRAAVCGSLLFAASLWHLQLSRVGFPVIAWPLAELIALLLLHLGIRTRRWPFWVGSGLAAGVSVWIYNSASLVVLAMGVYVGLWLLWQTRRGFSYDVARDWVLALILLASTVLGAWPLIEAARDPANNYRERFEATYAFDSERADRCRPVPEQQRDPACRDALQEGLRDRTDVVVRKVKELYQTLTTKTRPDGADGLGIEPPLGEIVMYLAIVGAAVALLKVRSPMSDTGFFAIPLLVVATALSIDGQYRRVFGMLPFLMLYAGITLGFVWEWADRQDIARRAAALGLVALAIAIPAAHQIRFYVEEFPDHQMTHFVFYPEMRHTSEYIDSLGQPYVYWYGERASLGHESRRVLAADIAGGEDRATEFSRERDAGVDLPRFDLKPAELVSYPAVRQPEGAVFVFTGAYALEENVDKVEARYPGGEVAGRYDERYGVWEYRAYYLPPNLLDSYARRESVTYTIVPPAP